MIVRMEINERLNWKNEPVTSNLVVVEAGNSRVVVGNIKFRTTGKNRVSLYLTSQVHGETIPVHNYETVADALAAAHDYISE